jgi:uncharacterized protein YndB with AHSA1/START domain
MTATGQRPQLNLRRTYAAPPALVFRALTEPKLLERWFRPSPDVTLRVEQLDLRVGGRYRFAFGLPGDRISTVIGEYRSVAPPNRLAFTWTWEPPDEHAGFETLVTVELAAKAGGSELTLTHTGFPTEEVMRRHQQGWGGCLEALRELAGEPL